jgi:hypothetical protein
MDGHAPGGADAPLRLAILSTPRSGNTWLRHLLAAAYAAPSLAVHSPDEVPWDALPRDLVLQLHWRRTPTLRGLLARHGFGVVVLARHPLDVLLSVLAFCAGDASTLRWLGAEHGGEAPLYGAMPTSAPFIGYAAGPRAAALLGVSREWRDDAGPRLVRYEALAADPGGELARLAEAVGRPTRRPAAETAAALTLEAMRRQTGHGAHFWQGRPGLWRGLLPAGLAEAVARAQADAFAAFGYACDPDPGLTAAAAEARWVELAGRPFVEALQAARSAERALGAARAEAAVLRAELAAARRALAPFDGLGPRAAAAARALHGGADLLRRLFRRGTREAG